MSTLQVVLPSGDAFCFVSWGDYPLMMPVLLILPIRGWKAVLNCDKLYQRGEEVPSRKLYYTKDHDEILELISRGARWVWLRRFPTKKELRRRRG